MIGVLKSIMCLGTVVAIAFPSLAKTSEASIIINDKVRYQHVSGFGGFSPSPTWQYWLNDKEMETLFGTGDDQLGLNILRLYMANNRNSWQSGVKNAMIAKKYGAFIFASPWSPPAAWKSNNSDSNGGSLLESHYDDWAKFLNDYYLYMLEKGVEIDAVSIQNEPDWKADYQSCLWTGEQMADFLKNHGDKIQCKIIAPEAIHFSRNMHEPILNDPEACENLDILGGHFYGWDGSSYPLAQKTGKEVWMTEYLINERQQNQNIDINWKDDGFLFARSINNAMLANMSAWVHYSLKRYYGCLGDGNYGTENNKITKRGYIMSHYAKYVSGTTRIRHAINDIDGQLSASAYVTEWGDSIIVMVINEGENDYDISLTLPFNTEEAHMIVTTETKNMEKHDLWYDDETYTPIIEVEPYSLNTYVFTKSSNREDTDFSNPDDALIFSDDFELYGASCVPEGWRVKFEDGIRYSGDYSLGPRIMSFSPESVMSHAFYFRTNTTGIGYIYYGQESDFRLSLSPGDYTLTYSTVGWKGCPEISALVQKTNNRTVAKTTTVPNVTVSANGADTRISETTDDTLDFEITESGNYILRWQLPAAAGGMNEALVGNIRLVKHEPNGIENVIIDNINADDAIYDLMGRRILYPKPHGLYIRNGKKYIYE